MGTCFASPDTGLQMTRRHPARPLAAPLVSRKCHLDGDFGCTKINDLDKEAERAMAFLIVWPADVAESELLVRLR